MSGIASTATGLLGKNRMSKLKGAFTVPHPTKRTSIKTAISLFSIKNLMLLFSIDLSYKTIRHRCLKNTTQQDVSYRTVKSWDNWIYCLKIKLNTSRLICRVAY